MTRHALRLLIVACVISPTCLAQFRVAPVEATYHAASAPVSEKVDWRVHKPRHVLVHLGGGFVIPSLSGPGEEKGLDAGIGYPDVHLLLAYTLSEETRDKYKTNYMYVQGGMARYSEKYWTRVLRIGSVEPVAVKLTQDRFSIEAGFLLISVFRIGGGYYTSSISYQSPGDGLWHDAAVQGGYALAGLSIPIGRYIVVNWNHMAENASFSKDITYIKEDKAMVYKMSLSLALRLTFDI